jgi:hypothetical protein
VSCTQAERDEMVRIERERAHIDAEKVWADARADGSFAKGYNRAFKQFSN